MSASVLGQLTLGYQWVWNRQRKLAAVQLFIDSQAGASVDAAHLMALLAQTWSPKSPQLILTVPDPVLLADLLAHAAADGPWIAVQDKLVEDALVAPQLPGARQRGLQLLWRGESGRSVSAETAACFARGMVTLSAGDALLGLHAALQAHGANNSPILADQIYESVVSRALVEHCLDQQSAWGVAGWPMEDVLHGYHGQAIQPQQQAIVRLIEAADADASMELIENTLAQEPLLAYRFLRFANSAGFGLRYPVESLRHGLMVLGLSTLRNWLTGQLPSASADANLQPVRWAMVVRARLMEQLLDAGEEDTLRREVVLCGLFSQIDLLLGEPLSTAMQHIPVSERVTTAVVNRAGPYAPFLHIATALEYPGMHALPALCEEHGLDIGDVNRTLLRVLARGQMLASHAGWANRSA